MSRASNFLRSLFICLAFEKIFENKNKCRNIRSMLQARRPNGSQAGRRLFEVPHDMRRGGVCLSKGGRHLELPHAPVLLFVFIDSFYVLHEMAFVYLPCDCSTLVYAYAHESESLCVDGLYGRTDSTHAAHIITIII